MTVAITILSLVATVLAVTALANRIRFSAPLLLMLVGIGISFLPVVPIPELSAELVLIGLLPPLLYWAALHTDLDDLRRVIDDGMPGTAMPRWGDRLTDSEREDVIAYIKSFSQFFTGAAPTPITVGRAPGSSAEAIAAC